MTDVFEKGIQGDFYEVVFPSHALSSLSYFLDYEKKGTDQVRIQQQGKQREGKKKSHIVNIECINLPA